MATITGTPNDDVLTGTNVADTINGLAGNDALSGLGGNDNLNGGDGNDRLDGGTGTDTMIGGLGDDTYVVDSAIDAVGEVANEGHDTIESSVTRSLGANVEDLLLTGLAAINGSGNDGINVITGNSANNVLNGGLGVDQLIGGAGNDTYIIDDAGEINQATVDTGIDLVRSSVTYSLGAEQENLILIGLAAIDATGNSGNNIITGNAAYNTLDGGAGNDTLVGGAGDDTYIVDSASDVITEGSNAGADTVRSSASYVLALNVEQLVLTGSNNLDGTGNALSNSLTGNVGNNVLVGKAGADVMTGGDGNDTYAVDNLGDVVVEFSGLTSGTDVVTSSLSYALGANLENLVLGGTGSINATGNDANNVITGNRGNNVLDGGAGVDTLAGGAGNDTYIIDDAGEINQATVDAGIDLVRSSVTYSLGAEQENLILGGLASRHRRNGQQRQQHPHRQCSQQHLGRGCGQRHPGGRCG